MPVKTIAVAGGGLAGWMVASVLSRQIPRQLTRIIVIDEGGIDDSLGPFVPALATLPSARHFHAQFGFNEDAIIATTGGGFSLGMAISGWAKNGNTVFCPFGDTGADMDHVGFHHLAMRLRAESIAVNLADYALAALCAQANRFIRPMPNNRSVLSTFDYGLVLDTARYCYMFKQDAVANGVTEIAAVIMGAELDKDGLVACVTTDNGPIHADLFLDCTGSSAMIVSAVTGVNFESWSHWLPCDHIANHSAAIAEPPLPYHHLATHKAGYCGFLTAMGMRHESTTFNAASTAGKTSGDAAYHAGRRSTLWWGNAVALGAAAAVIDPLSPLSLNLLQSAIQHLVTLLPTTKTAWVEAAQFNEVMTAELNCARDFAIMPYYLNGRIDEPFWDACRIMTVPDTLAHKINLYKATGRIALYDGEYMTEADWIVCFDAQGIYPARYDPAANSIPLDEIKRHFARIRQIMLHAVGRVPFHTAYHKDIPG